MYLRIVLWPYGPEGPKLWRRQILTKAEQLVWPCRLQSLVRRQAPGAQREPPWKGSQKYGCRIVFFAASRRCKSNGVSELPAGKLRQRGLTTASIAASTVECNRAAVQTDAVGLHSSKFLRSAALCQQQRKKSVPALSWQKQSTSNKRLSSEPDRKPLSRYQRN